MKSFLIYIHAVQELDAMSHQEGFWIETDLLESGDECGTLLRRWNFLQTSAI
jgi:hypothetical protein